MPTILELREVEKLIEAVASKIKVDGTELDDRLQIGRIAVWQLLTVHQITRENLSDYRGLIWTTVEHALLNEYKKTRAKKRPQANMGQSFDAPLGDEDDRTLQDVLPSDEPTPLDHLLAREKPDWSAALAKATRDSYKLRTAHSKRLVVLALVQHLGLNPREIPKRVNYQTFVGHGLQAWLWVFFNNSPFRALNCAYPGRYLPYHMARAPQRYWSGRSGKRRATTALRNILTETGALEEIYPQLLTSEFLDEFKLGCPLQKIFGWDRFAYLDAAFPGRYRPWEFSTTPKFFFDKEDHVIEAVRWLVELKLAVPLPNMSVGEVWDQRVAYRITKQVFSDYGLREIIAIYKSPEPVLRLVYPDKFLPWSFQNKKKWVGKEGKKMAAKATRWLLEEHLHISPFSPDVGWELFRRNGLHGMITSRQLGFNSSPRAVLRNAYPEFSSNFSEGA